MYPDNLYCAPSAGVEHLLRDVKDASVSTLAAEVGTLAAGLGGLRSRLLQVQEYLGHVAAGRLPVNHDILYQLQARAPLPVLACSAESVSGLSDCRCLAAHAPARMLAWRWDEQPQRA